LQAALREGGERSGDIADNAPVLIWVTDASGACVYLNKLWYDLTGQAPARGYEFGWLDAVHPEDLACVRDMFQESGNRHEAFRAEHRLRGKDGSYRWVLNTAAPRFGADAQFLGYIGSTVDIDDLKQPSGAALSIAKNGERRHLGQRRGA
jgi:PAS domain S-box-containing protein